MNVVQRKALADAMGLNVTDLGKIIAGEKTSAEMAEEKQKAEADHLALVKANMTTQNVLMTAQLGLQSASVRKSLASAAGAIFSTFAKIPLGLGIPLAIGAATGMYSLATRAPKLETGGVVKESGMAEVHRGEVFSGTNDEMSMSTKETNKILREMLAQNEILMRKLTGEIVDMKLA